MKPTKTGWILLNIAVIAPPHRTIREIHCWSSIGGPIPNHNATDEWNMNIYVNNNTIHIASGAGVVELGNVQMFMQVWYCKS